MVRKALPPEQRQTDGEHFLVTKSSTFCVSRGTFRLIVSKACRYLRNNLQSKAFFRFLFTVLKHTKFAFIPLLQRIFTGCSRARLTRYHKKWIQGCIIGFLIPFDSREDDEDRQNKAKSNCKYMLILTLLFPFAID
ncbi:hypothetical protein J6590_099352 [Homalodisca vitripennis]|nr:hypothetical protein J6590_099352 [Homalodisca vitripennis]